MLKTARGVFESILGDLVDTILLEVRIFDEATKKSEYAKQTAEAEAGGTSNRPHCAIGHDANKSKIRKLTEMDADHVTAWSKGGATAAKIAKCSARRTIEPRETDKKARV